MAAETRSVIVRNVPPEIREAIRAAVVARKSNMNDVVVGALAKSCKIPFSPTGRENTEGGDYETLILRVPVELRAEIRQRAAAVEDLTATDVILRTLARHFKLSAISRRRRPGRRPRTPVA